MNDGSIMGQIILTIVFAILLVVSYNKSTKADQAVYDRYEALSSGEVEREDTPYKDSVVNRYEGQREFWGGMMFASILILCLVCPIFRYLIFSILGVALLGMFGGND